MAPEHDPRPAGEQSPAAVPPTDDAGTTAPTAAVTPALPAQSPPPQSPPGQDPLGENPQAQSGASRPPAPGAPALPTAQAQAPAPVARQGGFLGWVRRRPFWGGLLVLVGGCEILLSERASITVVLHAGAESLTGYLLPGVIAVCGLLLLFNPMHRMFYSVIAVLCSLGTWVTSNLGGFVIGMLLGVVGSSLAFGWLPDQEPRRRRRRKTGTARA
ncbi:DUF6114 domain-containing protein [Streptomyces sp. NBC_01497]|uniref:DUF6114 domain-containing protein n=1 Tax=Streptomyces sp. NBC_01497 TaxID=2903885 RepID=UPI003FCE000F